MQEISKILADKYEEVTEKINSFSNEYLNEEYKNICIEATIVLRHGDKKEIKELMEQRMQKRLILQY